MSSSRKGLPCFVASIERNIPPYTELRGEELVQSRPACESVTSRCSFGSDWLHALWSAFVTYVPGLQRTNRRKVQARSAPWGSTVRPAAQVLLRLRGLRPVVGVLLRLSPRRPGPRRLVRLVGRADCHLQRRVRLLVRLATSVVMVNYCPRHARARPGPRFHSQRRFAHSKVSA